MAGEQNFAWLMKSEPTEVSVDDVLEMDGHKVGWFGVRNYQARNFMRDDCKVGDPVLFYHSSCKEPGIVGVGEIASEPYPDPTQFEEGNEYFDPKSTKEKPRWVQVDVKVLYKVKTVSLAELRAIKACEDMAVLRKGNRLSITPVSKKQFEAIKAVLVKI